MVLGGSVCGDAESPACRGRRLGGLGRLGRLQPLLWYRGTELHPTLRPARTRQRRQVLRWGAETVPHLQYGGERCWSLRGVCQIQPLIRTPFGLLASAPDVFVEDAFVQAIFVLCKWDVDLLFYIVSPCGLLLLGTFHSHLSSPLSSYPKLRLFLLEDLNVFLRFFSSFP